ncbi:MAG: BTB/POZ domain-containing protein [Candidatus Protochlamydia sp.]|nr:BTB/POZ domain-containing protein [Candidatus Protochlamydia sp.]
MKLLGVLKQPSFIDIQSLQNLHISSTDYLIQVEKLAQSYQEKLQACIYDNVLIYSFGIIDSNELQGFTMALENLSKANHALEFCIKGHSYKVPLSFLLHLINEKKLNINNLLINHLILNKNDNEIIELPGYAFHALITYSHMLQTLYSGNFKEKGQIVLTIEKPSNDILISMLEHFFINFSNLKDLDTEDLCTFLVEADYLQIEPLKNLYAEEMQNKLICYDTGNVLQIIKISELVNSDQLKKRCSK